MIWVIAWMVYWLGAFIMGVAIRQYSKPNEFTALGRFYAIMLWPVMVPIGAFWRNYP